MYNASLFAPRALGAPRAQRAPRALDMPRAPRVFAISVVVALALGGCTAGSSDAPSDSQPSAFYSLVDETQSVAGGTWQNQDDPRPRGCVLSLWMEGQSYPALRIGPAPRDLNDIVAGVTAMWSEWGYAVQRQEIAGVIELQGRGPDALLIFRASANAMTLQGESECIPP